MTTTRIAKYSEVQELEALRDKLENLIVPFCEAGHGPETIVPGLNMAMTTTPIPPTAYLYEPSLCVCIRGQKKILIGKDAIFYDSKNYMLTCIGMPTIISIEKASPQNPYVGLLIRLDLELARSIIAEMEISGAALEHDSPAMVVRAINAPLLEAVYRLANLTNHKKDVTIMAPLLQREILYRLLSGPSGDRLRTIAQLGSQTNRVARSVAWIRENFEKKLSIEDLADIAAMGVSTFHRHFQELTTMSPIQYQKHLRLHEARRLMLVENADAATSAVRVGYESVTQFSREYRRLFGQPPAADKKRLVQTVPSPAGI